MMTDNSYRIIVKGRNFYRYFTEWHHQNQLHRSHTVAVSFGFPSILFQVFYRELVGFPGGSDSKESLCNVGGLGSIPGLGRSPGRGMATLFSVLTLENPQGQMSLAGYSPWGLKEMDTTEWLSIHAWRIDSFCNITSGTLQKKNHGCNMTLRFGLFITKKHINQLDGVQRKARKTNKRMKGLIY